MSVSVIKVLEATVSDGVVKIGDIEANDVVILGAGGDSSGYVLAMPERALYIVNTQPDLQHTIDQLVTVIEQLKELTEFSYITAVVGTGVQEVTKTQPFSAVTSQLDSIKEDLEGYALK